MGHAKIRLRAILPDTMPQRHAETAKAPWDSPPPPIAVNARRLSGNHGPCAICSRALLVGQRAADLADSGRTVHVGCIGAAS